MRINQLIRIFLMVRVLDYFTSSYLIGTDYGTRCGGFTITA